MGRSRVPTVATAYFRDRCGPGQTRCQYCGHGRLRRETQPQASTPRQNHKIAERRAATLRRQ